MLPYIQILGRQIPTYWLMGLVGLSLCSWFLFVRNKRAFHLKDDDVLHILLFTCIGAVLGSKLLGLITLVGPIIGKLQSINWTQEALIDLFTGGYVFYGGLIGAIAMAYYYCSKYNIPTGEVMELATPAIPLFHAFGRVGCFLAGCCYGVHGYPLQLVEAGCNLAIFVGLLCFQKNVKWKGYTFYVYLFVYGVCRFVLEFFRGDAIRGRLWLLSTSQWLSLGFVILSIIFIRKRAYWQKS